jgi:hypothetical protein
MDQHTVDGGLIPLGPTDRLLILDFLGSACEGGKVKMKRLMVTWVVFLMVLMPGPPVSGQDTGSPAIPAPAISCVRKAVGDLVPGGEAARADG